MKKFFATVLAILFFAQGAWAFVVDTDRWVDNYKLVDVEAVEIDLKSDLKNDFRVFQVIATNKASSTVDLVIPSNLSAAKDVETVIKSGLTFKQLMELPTQIATESYKEDVGTGVIAGAHKGLIYAVSTAGAICAGAGFLGFYPQQKTEEYFAHKKIRNEFKRLSPKIVGEFTLTANEKKDFLLFVPIVGKTPFIKVLSRNDQDENIYSDYHQL